MEKIKELKQEDIFKIAIAELYLADRRKAMVRCLRKVGIKIKESHLEDIVAS